MSKTKKQKTLNIVLSAMFLALGIVLPIFTGQIREIGNMLLPMHLTVMLCGLICGWQYGALVGVITPLLRSLLFNMPKMYPNAVCMAFELAAYGFIIGILYSHAKRKNILTLYVSLILSMLGGRVVWGIVQSILLGFGDNGFTLAMFISRGFVTAVPGIILQFVLIPAIMLIIGKVHIKR